MHISLREIMKKMENERETLLFVCSASDAGVRLDVCISNHSKLSRSGAQRLCDEFCVSVNGEAQPKKYPVKCGDEIEVLLPEPKPLEAEPENILLDIVYEDGDLIVVNKPKGMVVHPAEGNYNGTLVNALLYHCKGSLSGINGVIRPGIVHRIDKNTSGLLVCAKNDAAHISLAEQIKAHSMGRCYEAIVRGGFADVKGTVNAPIARHPTDRKRMAVVPSGKEAITHYEVIKQFKGFSYIRLRLETGRTHQIRVHMKSIGHPLLGDTLYGGGGTQFEEKHSSLLCEQTLHARTLEFVHPRTGEKMSFDSPLPEYFEKLLTILENVQ